MQLFAKYENILRKGFRATLNFRKTEENFDPMKFIPIQTLCDEYKNKIQFLAYNNNY